MAHKKKYTRGSIYHLFAHYDRSKEVPELKEPANTVLNYNLASNDQPQNQLDFLHQRLSEIRVHNRKDVNVMVDWVVTLPEMLKNKGIADEELFFKEVYNFLNNRYGKENVISAYVHMDETTPHIHYAFVPVTEDEKHGGYKLSAKEVITRGDLRTFHSDLDEYMENVFGRNIGILNEATREGNKSIEELKKGTAREELNKITQNVQKMTEDAQKLQEGIEVALKEKKAIQGEIKGLERQLKGVRLKLDEITRLQPQRTLTGTIKGVSLEDIENLKKTALMATRVLAEVNKLTAENKELKEMVKNLKTRIPSVKDKIRKTREEAELLEKAQAFDRLPEDVKRQLLQIRENIQKNTRLER